MKGAIPSDQSRPQGRFDVQFRFAQVAQVNGDEPLLAEITDLKTDTLWLKRVVSQGGAPAVVELIGGASPDLPRKRFPATAIGAVYTEVVRLWDEDGFSRFVLMGAGFTHRPLRPYQPGKQPDSPENLAVRARRVHRYPYGIEEASDTERDAYKRARRNRIVSQGALTSYGEGLVEVVDEAKAQILVELEGNGVQTRWALDSLLETDFSENVVDAAIGDLVADGRVVRAEVRCTHCGELHHGVTTRVVGALPSLVV